MGDIDDILADVTGDDVIPTETRDLRRLTRAWVNERASPELMPYPQDVMERVMNRIRRQVERVETETGQVDPKTNFQLIIIQTELERFKFLVRSFLRARMAKIDKYPLHLLSTSELSSRLSGAEQRYLHQHQTLLHRHYLSSFLAGFPDRLRRLDDTAGGISMIDRPNLDVAVLIRVLRDVNLPDPAAARPTVEAGGARLAAGEICVIRYHLIRDALSSGDVELL